MHIKQDLKVGLISVHVSRGGMFSLLPPLDTKSPSVLAEFKLGQFVV